MDTFGHRWPICALTRLDLAATVLIVPSTTASRQPERKAKPRPRKQPNLTLIAFRINAGHSRESLALRIGIGKETIRLAEAGFTPTPRIQFALASEFKTTPLEIWPLELQRRPR